MKTKLTKSQAIEKVAQPNENYYKSCLAYAKYYVKRQSGKFTSEDCIIAYNRTTQPKPKENRVWGAVFVKLKALGLIKHSGFTHAKIKTSHQKPINVWRTAV